jgi:hypothetical protein
LQLGRQDDLSSWLSASLRAPPSAFSDDRLRAARVEQHEGDRGGKQDQA